MVDIACGLVMNCFPVGQSLTDGMFVVTVMTETGIDDTIEPSPKHQRNKISKNKYRVA